MEFHVQNNTNGVGGACYLLSTYNYDRPHVYSITVAVLVSAIHRCTQGAQVGYHVQNPWRHTSSQHEYYQATIQENITVSTP